MHNLRRRRRGEGSLLCAEFFHGCHLPGGLAENGEVVIQSCASLVNTRLFKRFRGTDKTAEDVLQAR